MATKWQSATAFVLVLIIILCLYLFKTGSYHDGNAFKDHETKSDTHPYTPHDNNNNDPRKAGLTKNNVVVSNGQSTENENGLVMVNGNSLKDGGKRNNVDADKASNSKVRPATGNAQKVPQQISREQGIMGDLLSDSESDYSYSESSFSEYESSVSSSPEEEGKPQKKIHVNAIELSKKGNKISTNKIQTSRNIKSKPNQTKNQPRGGKNQKGPTKNRPGSKKRPTWQKIVG